MRVVVDEGHRDVRHAVRHRVDVDVRLVISA